MPPAATPLLKTGGIAIVHPSTMAVLTTGIMNLKVSPVMANSPSPASTHTFSSGITTPCSTSTSNSQTTSYPSFNSTFFAPFSDFTPDLASSTSTNFGMLALARGWRLNSKTWRRHWHACFGVEFTPELNPYVDPLFPSFFACFPGFQPDDTAPIEQEFARLAKFMGWSGCVAAVYRGQAYGAEFGRAYGRDANASRLERWQD